MSDEEDCASHYARDCSITLLCVSTVQDSTSPLYIASQEGHTDVVDILIKAGADIHQATTEVCIT